jgi:UDP-N-acetylmuramoylalanine--D-glutamate ligase
VTVELRGKRVLVMGLGRSGLGAARLCAELGARVTGTDLRSRENLGPEADELVDRGIALVLGEHRTADFVEADLVVLSPGIRPDQPQVAAAAAAGVPVLGELELAASQLGCPVLAVTGTNGKSTTTTFAGELLRAAGWATFVGGNLGTPLSDGVLERRWDAAVVEVSSFQLESAPGFHPRVAAMLNCTEDHLDRYPDFAAYRAAKERIFANLGPADVVVYNAADPIVREMVADLPGRRLAFCAADVDGAHTRGGALVLRDGDRTDEIDLAAFAVPGSHNVENLMAAVLGAGAMGVPLDAIRDALPRLRGLPHRMEHVRTLERVSWFNDSKATNVASAAKTLEGAVGPDGAVAAVILLGGKDKGGDYRPLVESMRGRVRCAVLYGAAAARIEEALADEDIPYQRVDDLDAAVALARGRARPGDAVLLAPACSSYDQFRNFEQRGDRFRVLVEALR